MKKCLPILFLLAVLLSGCGAETRELPPPTELFAAIQADVGLPEMVDTAETDLEALTGIGPDSYDGAVCCRLCEGTAPDEIIIVRGRDEEAAGSIQELLEKRLDYKQESGRLYLTEYQPMLRAGIVRRDGLTVSLIVSGQVEEILRVYDGLVFSASSGLIYGRIAGSPAPVKSHVILPAPVLIWGHSKIVLED